MSETLAHVPEAQPAQPTSLPGSRPASRPESVKPASTPESAGLALANAILAGTPSDPSRPISRDSKQPASRGSRAGSVAGDPGPPPEEPEEDEYVPPPPPPEVVEQPQVHAVGIAPPVGVAAAPPPAEPVVPTMRLRSPNYQTHAAGEYTQEPGLVNGRPLWKHKADDLWLYSNLTGCWTLGGSNERDRQFDCNNGFMIKQDPESEAPWSPGGIWMVYDSATANWREDPEILAEDTSPPMGLAPGDAILGSDGDGQDSFGDDDAAFDDLLPGDSGPATGASATPRPAAVGIGGAVPDAAGLGLGSEDSFGASDAGLPLPGGGIAPAAAVGGAPPRDDDDPWAKSGSASGLPSARSHQEQQRAMMGADLGLSEDDWDKSSGSGAGLPILGGGGARQPRGAAAKAASAKPAAAKPVAKAAGRAAQAADLGLDDDSWDQSSGSGGGLPLPGDSPPPRRSAAAGAKQQAAQSKARASAAASLGFDDDSDTSLVLPGGSPPASKARAVGPPPVAKAPASESWDSVPAGPGGGGLGSRSIAPPVAKAPASDSWDSVPAGPAGGVRGSIAPPPKAQPAASADSWDDLPTGPPPARKPAKAASEESWEAMLGGDSPKASKAKASAKAAAPAKDVMKELLGLEEDDGSDWD